MNQQNEDEVQAIIRSALDSAFESSQRLLSEPPTQAQIDQAIRRIVAMKVGVPIGDVGAVRWEGNTVTSVDVLVRGHIQSFDCSIEFTR